MKEIRTVFQANMDELCYEIRSTTDNVVHMMKEMNVMGKELVEALKEFNEAKRGG